MKPGPAWPSSLFVLILVSLARKYTAHGSGRKGLASVTQASIELQAPLDRFFAWNVDPFHRRSELAHPDARHKVPLLGDEIRHVDDLEQFTLAKLGQHRAA